MYWYVTQAEEPIPMDILLKVLSTCSMCTLYLPVKTYTKYTIVLCDILDIQITYPRPRLGVG